MNNTKLNLSDKDLLMLDDIQSQPVFIKAFAALLQRVPPEVMDTETKLVYCVCWSLQKYYQSLSPDAKLHENQILLAKQCGMSTRTLTRCLNNLYKLNLMFNYTPGKRNNNHIYDVFDWTVRRDLLTQKSVNEMRDEHKKTGVSYSNMCLYLNGENPEKPNKVKPVDADLPVITTKPYLITTKWKLITTKRKLITTVSYMNKIYLSSIKYNYNNINNNINEIISNVPIVETNLPITSHKEEVEQEEVSSFIPSLSESVASLSPPINRGPVNPSIEWLRENVAKYGSMKEAIMAYRAMMEI